MKTLKKQIFLFSLLITNVISSCGQKSIKDIYFNNREDSCFGFNDRYCKDSDTLNYYVILESTFYNDTVAIYNGNNVIYSDIITTDGTHGFTKKVLVGNVASVSKIKININNCPSITLNTEKGKYYYRVLVSWYGEKMEICCSKHLPYYR